MRSDRKAMHFVAHPLDEIQHRIVVPQCFDGFASTVEFLFACIAIFALGDTNHGNIAHAKCVHNLADGADLALPTINQQQIRPSALRPLWVFFQKTLKAAGKHLFHHAQIIAGGDACILDIKLAILVFVEPIRARHDHRTHRMGALNMRVIVHLDPRRHLGQIKRVGDAFQQATLRCGFRHLTSQAFAGIAHGRLDQLCLFAALRNNNFNFAPGLFGHRISHQVIVIQPVRQDQHAGRFAVGIELADKSFHHFGHVLVTANTREIIMIAPVLIGTDKEDLHAGLPTIGM